MSNSDSPEAINGAIKAELARRDLTRAQLTAALNEAGIAVQRSGVTLRLQGQREWKLNELQIVAAWIGVPLSVLVGGEQQAVAS